ncbi:MAG: cation:dicarboxylate symporter family transporter, partial [Gemmataceae bacterium]
MAGAAAGSQVGILLGLGAGAVAGLIANALMPQQLLNKLVDNITRPIGEIFISLLFMPIVPLVFASVTLGVSKLGGAGA